MECRKSTMGKMRKIFCRIFRILPVVSYSSVRPHICSLSSFTVQAPVGCIFNYRSRRLIYGVVCGAFVSCTHLGTYCVFTCLGVFLCDSVHHQCTPIYYIHTYTCTRRAVTSTPKTGKTQPHRSCSKKTQGL